MKNEKNTMLLPRSESLDSFKIIIINDKIIIIIK